MAILLVACASGVTELGNRSDASSSSSANAAASTAGVGGAPNTASAAITTSTAAGGGTDDVAASTGVGGAASASSSTVGAGGTSLDCSLCTPSVAPACGSTAVVVGHYEGGQRTICIEPGTTTFDLALMSYETTQWALTGDISRVTNLQIYSFDPFGSITGNGNVPLGIQVGGSSPANPYDYATSMADCAAHTGYAGAVFNVAQANVCHMETGLPSQCSYPTYSCLAIDP